MKVLNQTPNKFKNPVFLIFQTAVQCLFASMFGSHISLNEFYLEGALRNCLASFRKIFIGWHFIICL